MLQCHKYVNISYSCREKTKSGCILSSPFRISTNASLNRQLGGATGEGGPVPGGPGPEVRMNGSGGAVPGYGAGAESTTVGEKDARAVREGVSNLMLGKDR